MTVDGNSAVLKAIGKCDAKTTRSTDKTMLF